MSNFPYYSLDELKDIKIGGHTPQDMTVPYSSQFIKDKRIKRYLRDDQDIFVISTEFKNPKYKFSLSQEVDIDSLYFHETRAICLGSVPSAIRGTRVISYFFQFV